MANRKIPGGVTLADFGKIDGFLRQILQETEAKEVHLRVNDSDDNELAPVFVGWVEDSVLKKNREAKNHPDPGLYRFGDTVLSSIYMEAYEEARKVRGAALFAKDWDAHLHEKRSDEKALAPKAGVKHQKCIGLVLKKNGANVFVGTLNVGFSAPPVGQANKKAESAMQQWAAPASPLVQWLDSEFKLLGPSV